MGGGGSGFRQDSQQLLRPGQGDLPRAQFAAGQDTGLPGFFLPAAGDQRGHSGGEPPDVLAPLPDIAAPAAAEHGAQLFRGLPQRFRRRLSPFQDPAARLPEEFLPVHHQDLRFQQRGFRLRRPLLPLRQLPVHFRRGGVQPGAFLRRASLPVFPGFSAADHARSPGRESLLGRFAFVSDHHRFSFM